MDSTTTTTLPNQHEAKGSETAPLLLACPFCGGRAKCNSYENGNAAYAYVACRTCGARTDTVPFGSYYHCKCPEFRRHRNRARRIWNCRALFGPLREDTGDLLLALHREFYSGPPAHADAFRILPQVVDTLIALGALPPRKSESQNKD